DLDGRDAVVNYANGWPVASGIRGHFNVNGPSLSVAVHEARIFDSRISNVDFHIADVKETLIELDGQHHGPAMDVVRYVRESPLHEKFATVADQLNVSGMQASNMRLRIPVKKQKGVKAEYQFSTVTHGAVFDFQNWGLRLGAANARFDYGDSSVSASPFVTQLNGHPVTVRLDSKDAGDVSMVTIGVRGNADPQRLLQKPFPQGLQYVNGVTDFAAEVRLALRNESGKEIPPALHIESLLQGIEIGLPAPFDKPADEPARFELNADFQPGGKIHAGLDYGGWLQGGFVLASTGAGLSLDSANLQANVVLPQNMVAAAENMPGITVQGRIPALNVDDWQKLKSYDGIGRAGLIDKLLQADLEVGRFTYLNRTVENADIRVTQELHNWKFELQSSLARGSVLIPKDGFERRGLAIDIGFLDFDRLNAGAAGGEPPLPTGIPPFQLSAERIVLNAWHLRNLKVLAAPVDDGIKAHSIRIEDPAIGMQGEGVWTVDDEALHHTGLNVRFESNNVGRGLENFGYSRVIKDGQGTAEFDVQWAGSPADFSLGLLTGSANLSLRDGQLLDIDPKGGRLLGLLSAQTIPRRLALDFKDVFAKGFRFDKMKGSFNFADGNAYTANYYIDGPAGRIDIEGRTGLLARDYDQRVLFRPDLSSSLPLVGTLLGGTSTGVAMIVVDRIARIFGKQTDDLARFEYRLTGSWDDPNFTPVLRRTAKRELSERSE
ncbi:MAG TPA: AsmA-like C-terminal region-containing protein, partial [Gammaproteobacteria bacterium]